MLEIGSLVDGKYKILNEVGRGGMSVVYLAMNEKANKQWAIKEVRKDGIRDFEVVKQGLIVETDMLKKLRHPSLPSIIDVIEDEDTFLIVMDYIEGNPLSSALEEFGAQPQELVISWAILTDPERTDAYLQMNDAMIQDFVLSKEEAQQMLTLQMGVEEKDRQGFSKKKDVLKELKEKNPEGYEKVCYEIGNSFLFYYDVNVNRDRYSSAKNWFKECVKSYPIAQVYCDISDCLDLINQYSEAKVKQTDKMYEAYGTLWEKVTELKKKEEKFEDVDARLQVWSEINDIVNEQVVPFLEVTSSNDLIQLLNDISDEAGNISKSVIKEDIDELQDKIQSTIQKINAAQEAGKK